MSIASNAPGYSITFEDQDGHVLESTATVTKHDGIGLTSFNPDIAKDWNGTAESLRRIARLVQDFDTAHTRTTPFE